MNLKTVLSYCDRGIREARLRFVETYNYLGTTISRDLTWSANIQRQVKKAWKRIFHLRKLNEFSVSKRIKTLFYSSVVESVFTFGVAVWGGNVLEYDLKPVKQVVRCATRIIGAPLSKLEDIYKGKANKLRDKIVADRQHPMNCYFPMLPSGHRFRQIENHTERLRRSLVPQAISLYNNNNRLLQEMK